MTSSVFIASIILAVIAGAYAVLLNRKLMETFILAAATVIGVLFCFGFINVQNCLFWGVCAVVLLGMASCALLIYKFIKDKTLFKRIEAWQGIVMFSLFLSFAIYLHYGRHLWSADWDSLPHWGLTVKHMFNFGAFRTFNNEVISDLLSNSYIPGTGLFNYFFTVFSPNFVESNAYIAQTTFYFILVMPFLKDIFTKRHVLRSLAILGAFLLLPLIEGQLFSRLYVDELLGMAFGFALLYYLIYKFEDGFGVFIVSAMLFLLTMIKDIGFILSIGVLVIIAADIIIFKRAKLKSIVFPLGAAFVPAISWKILVNYTNTISTPSPTLNNIATLLTGRAEPYHYETVQNLLTAVFKEPFYASLPVNITLFMICTAFLLGAAALAYLYRNHAKRLLLMAVLLFCGMAGYLFALLLVFCYSFNEWSALRIGVAYQRYVVTYLFGMLLFLLYALVSDEPKTMPRKRYLRGIAYTVCAVLALSLCVLTYKNAYSYVLIPRAESNPVSESYKPRATSVVERWKPYMAGENVYLITQGEYGLSALMLGYDLYPQIRGSYPNSDWSIGLEPYYPFDKAPGDDEWTKIWTADEWEDYVYESDYTVIYIFHADDKFIDTYGRFFQGGVQDDMLYTINFDDGGNMTLIPVAMT